MLRDELRSCFRVLQKESNLQKDHAIVITNISTSLGSGGHYCVIIDPLYVMFATREPVGTHTIRYDLKENVLYHNRMKSSLDKLPELITKLFRAISDVRHHQARMYTKPCHVAASMAEAAA